MKKNLTPEKAAIMNIIMIVRLYVSDSKTYNINLQNFFSSGPHQLADQQKKVKYYTNIIVDTN